MIHISNKKAGLQPMKSNTQSSDLDQNITLQISTQVNSDNLELRPSPILSKNDISCVFKIFQGQDDLQNHEYSYDIRYGKSLQFLTSIVGVR